LPHILLVLLNIFLIKNGVGNRPADAVAAGFDFACLQTGLSERRVLNPAFPILSGGKDEMKINCKPLHFIDRGFFILKKAV
jgi:hypothetical protein